MKERHVVQGSFAADAGKGPSGKISRLFDGDRQAICFYAIIMRACRARDRSE
jgi:hypothetical protein